MRKARGTPNGEGKYVSGLGVNTSEAPLPARRYPQLKTRRCHMSISSALLSQPRQRTEQVSPLVGGFRGCQRDALARRTAGSCLCGTASAGTDWVKLPSSAAWVGERHGSLPG